MKISLLGTGDAIGTPKIGCSCPQCRYALQHGLQRLRTSFLIRNEEQAFLIDSSPDLRQQLLRAGSPVIRAVVWTHGHYDHFMGFGEFYRIQDLPTTFGAPGVLEYCRKFFSFLPFTTHPVEPFRPFRLCGLDAVLFPVSHPPCETYGILLSSGDLRIGFTSDTNADIPGDSLSLLDGADLLFIDALVPPPLSIPKHMNYHEASELARILRVREWRCVNMSHHIPWDFSNTGFDGEEFSYRDP